MKYLKDYKETIHRCSKCGLCQSVCPIFQITGNECSVSRGLFIMLQGVIKGDIKLGKKINKYLDTCLKCGKCTEFCPSDIDIVQVLCAAKHENFKFSLIESKFVFNTILKLLKILLGRQKKRNYKSDKKVVYFGGCIEKINPRTSEFVKDILNKVGYEIIDIDFNCCGMPFLTSGNLKRFEQQMYENIKKIINLEFEYLVTDCASCEWSWREYLNYIEDDELKNRFQNIKFKNIYEIIAESNIQFESKKNLKLTYHTPCHEKNDASEQVLQKIDNIEYIQLYDKKQCCGFSGMFSNDNAIKEIRINKKNNIKSCSADLVLTSCIGCVISLSLLLKTHSVHRVIDFLQKYCKLK